MRGRDILGVGRAMARKEAAIKTNAARLLEAAGIPFEIREYEVDEDDLSAPRVARCSAHSAAVVRSRRQAPSRSGAVR